VLTIASCSSRSATVSGKVTVDGTPLTKGSVRYIPDKEKGNTSTDEAVGEINASGVYELRTNNQPGAPTGWYKVCVVSTDTPDNTNPSAPVKSYVDAKYKTPATTDLSKEVKSGAPPGAYDLTVTPGSGTTATTGKHGGVPAMPK
jgi:hypothetical protein